MRLKAGLSAAALLVAGCSQQSPESSNTPESSATVAVAAAIGEAQSADVPLGARFLGGFPLEVRRWEHEGQQCDDAPETATVEVCGQAYPSELHLSWSDCQARVRGRGGCGWNRGGPGAPPPPAADDAGTPTEDGGMVSAGTVDVVTAITPEEACGEHAPLRFEQQSTHDITHTATDGQRARMTGNVSSTTVRIPGAETLSRAATFDTTRTHLDAEGAVLDSLHLAGNLSEVFDPTATTPTRTSNGTLTATLADGSASTVTLTDIVRVPPSTCAWPVSGTEARTLADGTVHTLVFGPECGQATLDDEAITLPSRPMGPRDGGFGGRPPGGGGQGGGGPRPGHP
ncbi:hypothetical protein LZ198_09720 [Myxococcus sp. K15C18031901]|uniref:hypothetical protein n=1 Tax=Myxococcus dinghuensis TaxID=2906761 RepID=UPI0020A80A8F|nr:hypothetical protein [Myxococcus dinghuensis]MCP3099145.1 hypothetical protein [Myxococcus dinghuensis]